MAGYREFQTGEVLTAANVNSFLMEQATMTFADAAARDAALAGVLREGLLTYNLDTNRLEVYDGTDWVEPAPEPPAGIGSNVVQAVKFDTQASSLGGGGITAISGLTCTITPSSATSKILVISHVTGAASADAIGFAYNVILKRDGTSVGVGTAAGSRIQITSGAAHAGNGGSQNIGFVFLDSPATASPVDYTLDIHNGVAVGRTLYVNRTHNDSNATDTGRGITAITAIEVSA